SSSQEDIVLIQVIEVSRLQKYVVPSRRLFVILITKWPSCLFVHKLFECCWLRTNICCLAIGRVFRILHSSETPTHRTATVAAVRTASRYQNSYEARKANMELVR